MICGSPNYNSIIFSKRDGKSSRQIAGEKWGRCKATAGYLPHIIPDRISTLLAPDGLAEGVVAVVGVSLGCADVLPRGLRGGDLSAYTGSSGQSQPDEHSAGARRAGGGGCGSGGGESWLCRCASQGAVGGRFERIHRLQGPKSNVQTILSLPVGGRDARWITQLFR